MPVNVIFFFNGFFTYWLYLEINYQYSILNAVKRIEKLPLSSMIFQFQLYDMSTRSDVVYFSTLKLDVPLKPLL